MHKPARASWVVPMQCKFRPSLGAPAPRLTQEQNSSSPSSRTPCDISPPPCYICRAWLTSCSANILLSFLPKPCPPLQQCAGEGGDSGNRGAVRQRNSPAKRRSHPRILNLHPNPPEPNPPTRSHHAPICSTQHAPKRAMAQEPHSTATERANSSDIREALAIEAVL